MANDINIKIEMDAAQKIVSRLGMQKGGQVQRFFTNEVARLCDPYIPMDTGTLKNTKKVTAEYVHYLSPYARRQYYTNKGKGLRGKYWDKRMWADRGNEIISSVQKYARGL